MLSRGNTDGTRIQCESSHLLSIVKVLKEVFGGRGFVVKRRRGFAQPSNDEDGEGYKGLVGFDHCGSSITIFPSNPVIKEKGLNFVGTYGMLVAENLEVSSFLPFSHLCQLFPLPVA